MVSLGCSFGGYHAVNIALRHPDLFTGMLSMSGAFDLSNFLDGYYDQDCYFNLPTHYLPNLGDPWFFDRYRRNSYVLATGWDDQCLGQNQNLDRIMSYQGHSPQALHLGLVQRARLAHMGAHGAGIPVKSREQGIGNREQTS